ncbi:MAG: 6-bladed beta-propeller [Cecembia sp.]
MSLITLKKILLSFIVFISLLGCKNNQRSTLKIICIPDNTNTHVYLSEFSEEINEIQLETSQNILLGFINDVIIYDDKLFIRELKKVSIFDLNGNFIKILGKLGDGPGEYRTVNSFTIDQETGDIYLSTYNKLIVYDSTFQLKEERKLGYPIGYLKILNGELWIVSEEIGVAVEDGIANRTNIYKLDKYYQIADTIPYRTIKMDKKRIGGYPFRYWMSKIEDELFMFMPVLTPENMMRDTLYRVEDKMVVPSVKFNFERKQSLDERDYQTLLLYNIVNSTSYYILEYDQDWKRYMFLYDKKNQRGYNLSEGLIDDEGDPVFLRPLDLDQDLFYYIKKTEFEDKTIEELNPLIGIVKLK